jgi:NAD(P)-dependent dehydrogenase (short-subunit alcohol dehydrogenase family)
MHINLSGKTAIITASTAGIGLATAKGLAAGRRQGYQVFTARCFHYRISTFALGLH